MNHVAIRPSVITTRLARIQFLPTGQLHARFKPTAVLDAGGFAEVLKAGLALQKHEAGTVLMEFPQNVDFTTSFVREDHHALANATAHTTALALVTGNSFLQRLFDLYFAYFPQPFPLQVFTEKTAALAWLNTV